MTSYESLCLDMSGHGFMSFSSLPSLSHLFMVTILSFNDSLAQTRSAKRNQYQILRGSVDQAHLL